MEKLEEGNLVLCTVKKIVGTTVFVEIEGNGEGTIVVSEISPGRIRNLRDYVVPNKKIVCKILTTNRGTQGNVTLSLRRVNLKETKEVMAQHKQEKSSFSILKTVLKDNAQETSDKIKTEFPSISEFLKQAKENPKILEKFIPKPDAEKVYIILKSKKEKKIEIKKEFKLTTNSSGGINIIKDLLKTDKVEILYLGSGQYTMRIEGKDFKEIKIQINKILEEIETKAKKNKIDFKLIEGKK
ncbi:MAG: hypothetical protein KKF56_03540 [Nanoarchaeota archaeon]|nr:hypothetical protein [Nanoarchaeota archaeon]